MEFLRGLNDCYQVVRSNILMMTPLPYVSQASSMVPQAKQQKEIKGFSTQQVEIDSSAFLSHQRQ